MTEIIYSGENQELLYKSLPYVYVGIRNSDGKYYIGARMAHMHKRRIISEDFGKIYFTSSERVKHNFNNFYWEIIYIGKNANKVFEFERDLIKEFKPLRILLNTCWSVII